MKNTPQLDSPELQLWSNRHHLIWSLLCGSYTEQSLTSRQTISDSTMNRSQSLLRKLNLVDILLEQCLEEGCTIEEPSEDEIESWTETEIHEYFSSQGRTRPEVSRSLNTPIQRDVMTKKSAPPSEELFHTWFPGLKQSGTLTEKPKGIVLCFHNAGNAEDMYTSEGTGSRRALSPLLEWCRRQGVECLAPQLPGRGRRMNEPFLKTAQSAAEEILKIVQHKLYSVPYFVVAHSMGCWIAYEWLLLARAQGTPLPKTVFFSGMPSPDISFAKRPWRQQHLLNEEEFMEECRAWDINELVFEAGMWKQYQPLLRSDFTLFDSYQWQHSSQPPFTFPIHTFWGSCDKRITQAMVEGWNQFTNNTFSCERIQGNHLWPFDRDSKSIWLNKIVQQIEHTAL